MPFQSSREADLMRIVFQPRARDRLIVLPVIAVFIAALYDSVKSGNLNMAALESVALLVVALVMAAFLTFRESLTLDRKQVRVARSVLGLAPTSQTLPLENRRFRVTPRPMLEPWWYRLDHFNQVQFNDGDAFGLGMSRTQAAELVRELNDFLDELEASR